MPYLMIKNKNSSYNRKVRDEIIEADEIDEIASAIKTVKISNHSSPAVINNQITDDDYLDKAIQNDDLGMADQLISI